VRLVRAGKIALGALSVLVVLAVVAGIAFAGSVSHVAAGITVGGVSVGGLTADEAQTKLGAVAARYASEPVVFTAAEHRYRIRPAALEVEGNWAAAAEEAVDRGDAPFPLRGLERVWLRLIGAEVEPTADVFQAALDERLDRIGDLGPEVVLIIPFTLEFSRVEAEAFVHDVLVGLLRAREVVVGFNHTFGRGARGTPELLQALAAPRGVRVRVIPPLTVNGVVVSSSSVRDALRRGDAQGAANLLGRPYTIRGVVSRGAERGRTLGFPTANIAAPAPLLLADGVYAGRAGWEGHSALAVINVGVRPTFGEETRSIEAHLLDVSADLYGCVLTIAFLARIRAEMRFPSAEALRTRINEDVTIARRLLTQAP